MLLGSPLDPVAARGRDGLETTRGGRVLFATDARHWVPSPALATDLAVWRRFTLLVSALSRVLHASLEHDVPSKLGPHDLVEGTEDEKDNVLLRVARTSSVASPAFGGWCRLTFDAGTYFVTNAWELIHTRIRPTPASGPSFGPQRSGSQGCCMPGTYTRWSAGRQSA